MAKNLLWFIVIPAGCHVLDPGDHDEPFLHSLKLLPAQWLELTGGGMSPVVKYSLYLV